MSNRITAKAIAAKLRAELRWLEKWSEKRWGKEVDDCRAANLATACFSLVTQSPPTDLMAWLKRQPHRGHLVGKLLPLRSEPGRRALAELTELAISCLESGSSEKVWQVGSLDVVSRRGGNLGGLEAAREALSQDRQQLQSQRGKEASE